MDIKKVILAYGLTVAEVARRLQITNVALSQHLNGNPSVKTLQRIADAVGCEVGEFFSDENNTQENGSFITCPHCNKKIPLEIMVK